MNLAAAKDAYRSGVLAKHEYIGQMHRLHSRLFEYPEFLRDTDIARIEITDAGVITTTRQAGIRMFCDPQDHRIVPIETLNFGQYEKDEMEMALRMIRPGATVFDIGANIGWYSLNVVRSVPDAQVFAFEPIPHTFDLLSRNIELNGAANIHPQPFGFSDQAGEIVFYFCDDSSVSASAANIGERADARRIACQVKTLDEFIDQTGLQVDFIKCDVEGAELRVFRGATKCLAAQRPLVLTEMLRKWSRKFGYHPNDIIRLFADLGYACFVLRGDVLQRFDQMDEATEDTNFFFLHSETHSHWIRQLTASRPVGDRPACNTA